MSKLDLAINSILKLYANSIVPNDPWEKREYTQGLRDSLESFKQAGLIVDYNLHEGTYELPIKR